MEAKTSQSAPSRKKRVAKILVNIFFGFCLLVLAGAATLTIMAKQSGGPVLVAGHQPFLVTTGSMEPTYRVDGFVVIRDGGFDSVVVDDVVAFSAAGLRDKTAVHRVIEIIDDGGERQFVTKGDNNKKPDGATVTRDNYVGMAVWNTNLTADFLQALSRPGGWLAVVVLPIAALILLYFAVRWLVGSSKTWQGKGLAVTIVLFAASAAIFASYLLQAGWPTNF